MLKDLLDNKNCFKLICGAGNEDAVEVEKLVRLYYEAGCRFFDLSANPEIVDAAKRALENKGDAYICVSVGIKEDPHANKAVIDENKCISCYSCDSVCPQGAIKYGKVRKYRCIGCGKCAKACPKDAITFEFENKNLKEVLPPIIEKGIDCIELHALGGNDDEVLLRWKDINSCYNGILSACISRGKLSEEQFVERIRKLVKYREPYTTIIQADGIPMSGGNDDYKSTLQAVATAELVFNEKLPVYLLISGGTNKKTSELAKMCDIQANGIAIGSFARKAVKEFIDRDDFLTNEEVFNSALEIAKDIVFHAKIQA